MKKLEKFVPDSLFPFVGRHHDIVGVMRNGKHYYRRVGKMDKERVTTDPKFNNSRLANREFGLGSTLAATIRKPLIPVLKDISDRWVHSRLSGAINVAFNRVQGTRGKRKVPLAKTLNALENFRYTKDRNLLDRYGYITINDQPVVNKPIITFNYHTKLHGKFKYPGYATHVRAKLYLTALSDLKPDNIRKKKPKYLPTNPIHGQTKIVHGPWIPINELALPTTQRTIEWHPDQEYPETIQTGSTIIATVALEVAEYNPQTGEELYNRHIAAQIIHAQKIEQNIIEKRQKTAKTTIPKPTHQPQQHQTISPRETIRQTWREIDPGIHHLWKTPPIRTG